jgi:O-antigen ligase
MALEGIKERPIFGWGNGNFNYVFKLLALCFFFFISFANLANRKNLAIL